MGVEVPSPAHFSRVMGAEVRKASPWGGAEGLKPAPSSGEAVAEPRRRGLPECSPGGAGLVAGRPRAAQRPPGFWNSEGPLRDSAALGQEQAAIRPAAPPGAALRQLTGWRALELALEQRVGTPCPPPVPRQVHRRTEGQTGLLIQQ